MWRSTKTATRSESKWTARGVITLQNSNSPNQTPFLPTNNNPANRFNSCASVEIHINESVTTLSIFGGKKWHVTYHYSLHSFKELGQIRNKVFFYVRLVMKLSKKTCSLVMSFKIKQVIKAWQMPKGEWGLGRCSLFLRRSTVCY